MSGRNDEAMRRRTDVEKLFDGSGVAELVGHHRDVVEAVKVGERLGVGLVFDELLRPAVEEADVRIRPQDLLAVELEDQSEHAVRGGVLRSANSIESQPSLRAAFAGQETHPKLTVKCRITPDFPPSRSAKTSSADLWCKSSTVVGIWYAGVASDRTPLCRTVRSANRVERSIP